MKKFKKAFAVFLAVMICLASTGCSSIMEMVMEGAGSEPVDLSKLDAGSYEGDFYDLDTFENLPEKFSKATPAFWRCTDDEGHEIYFLGSIHVADDSAYRFNKKIMDKFIDADALAVEVDISEFESNYIAQIKMSAQYMYLDGSKVTDHISQELHDELVKVIEKRPATLEMIGGKVESLDMFKPVMWESLLDNIVVEECGLDSTLGIDQHFLNLANEMGKSILEVESIQFQSDFLANQPDEYYEMTLSGYLEDGIELQAEGTKELYEMWKKGDVKELTDALAYEKIDYTLEENGGLTEEQAKIYDDFSYGIGPERNKGMADKAEEYLASGKTVFFVVGTAHFMGDEGIIELMKDRGYNVEFLGGKNLGK